MQLLKQKGVDVCVALAAVCLTATAYADDTNAVQMVTYFPVPYAQYNNLYPQTKLDIGTVDEKNFELNVGNCSGDDAPAPFKAENVNLRNIAETPVLNMKKSFKTTTATLGKTANNDSQNTVSFTNLYLSNTALSVSEAQVTTLKAEKPSHIYMLKAGLPDTGCTSGQVGWVELNFGTTSEDKKRYLACCDSDNPNDSCGTPCQGMENLQGTCEMTTALPGNAPHHGKSAQVAGSWLGKNNVNNCNCDCSSASYTAAITNQSLTGADRIGPYNVADENQDYDYCVQKCWSHTNNGTGGDVAACINSTWQGVSVGATWNYNDCSCNCPAPYDKKVGYACTYRCDTEYEEGKIYNCENGSIHNGTWDDSSCDCICGDGYLVDSDGSCQNRCVPENSGYRNYETLCTNGGHGQWTYSDDPNECGCRCDDDYELVGKICKKKAS